MKKNIGQKQDRVKTEREKEEERRREMMANAVWRDKEREKNTHFFASERKKKSNLVHWTIRILSGM